MAKDTKHGANQNGFMFGDLQWQGQDQDQWQDQDQDQDQDQHQTQDTEVDLDADLDSENTNDNDNTNDNTNTDTNTNDNDNDNTSTHTTDSDFDSSLGARSTHNSNHTTDTDTDVDVDVDVDFDMDMEGYMPTDDDFADIDVKEGGETGHIAMAREGDAIIDIGDDIDVEDVLNNALNGEGNDSAAVNVMSNRLSDNDTLDDPDVTNSGSGGFSINADVLGGDADSGDGINADGGMGHALSSAGHAGAHGGEAETKTEVEAEVEDVSTGSATADKAEAGNTGQAGNADSDGSSLAVAAAVEVGDATAEDGIDDDNEFDDDNDIDQTFGDALEALGRSGTDAESDGGEDSNVEDLSAEAWSYAMSGYAEAMAGDVGDTTGGSASTGPARVDYATGDVSGGNGGSGGQWGSGNGDDGFVEGTSASSADAVFDAMAFNQSISMGANVLGNQVDMTTVGGNLNSTSVVGGEDADA